MTNNNEKINNMVPKDTVDSIMKTYENIIKQHLERMEQISESVKRLSDSMNSLDKDKHKHLDDISKDIREKIAETLISGKQSLEDLMAIVQGANPENDTNIKGIMDKLDENTKIMKENQSILKMMKTKLSIYTAIFGLLFAFGGTTYYFIQKSNEFLVKNTLNTLIEEVTEQIKKREQPAVEFYKLDKNNDGKIDVDEWKQHK
jgi:hypothetical protein